MAARIHCKQGRHTLRGQSVTGPDVAGKRGVQELVSMWKDLYVRRNAVTSSSSSNSAERERANDLGVQILQRCSKATVDASRWEMIYRCVENWLGMGWPKKNVCVAEISREQIGSAMVSGTNFECVTLLHCAQTATSSTTHASTADAPSFYSKHTSSQAQYPRETRWGCATHGPP